MKISGLTRRMIQTWRDNGKFPARTVEHRAVYSAPMAMSICAAAKLIRAGMPKQAAFRAVQFISRMKPETIAKMAECPACWLCCSIDGRVVYFGSHGHALAFLSRRPMCIVELIGQAMAITGTKH